MPGAGTRPPNCWSMRRRRLERGGADFMLICTNTMHRMADDVQAAVSIPLLHIADPTAERIKQAGFKRIGLLGTAFTMEQDFYKGRLTARHGLDVLVPGAEDRRTVHRVIYDELVQGRVDAKSRAAYRRHHRAAGGAAAPRPSSWDAPRSCCWSAPKTARCRCSTPPRSMPMPRSSGRWDHRNRLSGNRCLRHYAVL